MSLTPQNINIDWINGVTDATVNGFSNSKTSASNKIMGAKDATLDGRENAKTGV